MVAANLLKDRGKQVGIVALDKKLMDRVGNPEGDRIPRDREKGDIAEPAVETVGADAETDDVAKSLPKGGGRGRGGVLSGAEGRIQGNGKLGGESG
jgi:hypothetical protein